MRRSNLAFGGVFLLAVIATVAVLLTGAKGSGSSGVSSGKLAKTSVEFETEFVKAQKVITAIFEYVTTHPVEFFDGRDDEPVERMAVDFIAGMTDRYAINLYERLFLPRPWA